MFSSLENQRVTLADDATLTAFIPSLNQRRLVFESLNVAKVTEIRKLCGMKCNPNKTHGMVVSRSRTLVPNHPDLPTGYLRLSEFWEPCLIENLH